MSHFYDGAVSVRVPATCANLGPGFDALGLALTLQDDLTARITDDGLEIEIDGSGADSAPRDETHLVVRAMRRGFGVLGAQPSGLSLTCKNRIPHSRGLGSSAAAIVAGLALARGLVEDGDERLTDAELLAMASAIEGHPDNVAPCVLGGLTVAWTHEDRAHAVRLEPAAAVRPVVLIPPFEASTELARGLLPSTVPHADASFNAARAALLTAALTHSPQYLLAATDDRLHQPYRAPAMRSSADLVSRLRAEGHAAVISGAGPTVLVLAQGEVEAELIEAFAPAGWRCDTLAIERRAFGVSRSSMSS
jgi:homoserine kinase